MVLVPFHFGLVHSALRWYFSCLDCKGCYHAYPGGRYRSQEDSEEGSKGTAGVS